MSLQSQFKSKVLLEKIEPLTVIKNELEIGMDQDIINADIKDEIDIEYHIISEGLIKSEPIPKSLLESERLESIETQIFIQTENTPFIKSEFENLVKTEDTSDRNLSVVSGNTHKKRKAKMDNCRLKYHCNKCKYKTLWRQNLEKHNVIHLKPNKIQYLCYHCPYKSNYKGNLTCHVFNHFKNGEVPFHCYICDFVTRKRDLIIQHFKKHPEHRSKWNKTEYKNQVEGYFKKRIRYNCRKCGFRTYQYAELKLHELSHEAERDDQHLKYLCDQCKYKTFRLSSLKRHKLIHLEPEEIQYFYCYHCSYKAKQKNHLNDHILRHFKNEEVPFLCYICDFVTRKRDLIIEHFRKHPEHVSKCDETDYEINLLKLTPKIKKRYNCKKCAFRTSQYEKLNLHELTHKTEVEMDDQYLKHQCDKCTYKTFRKKSFKQHKLIHLKPEEIQWFYCYHCSYKAKQMSNLKGHILRHFKREEVPFHCYICDFVTKKRDLIFEHFKKHPKHISKYELTQESKVEMDDQYLKHQCDKCTYKTFRKERFKQHKLIHLKPEEIQWFYCYHCSYKAKQISYLKGHILGHFKRQEVPFHCYICDFVTRKRDLIIEHFKKHPEHVSKCDETDYEINLLKLTSKTKKSFRYELTQKSEVEMDDQYLKHQCDKCTYKTYKKGILNSHKLIHLKPEEIQYCYHCSYKAKRKSNLKDHILRHFKYEEVPFHCYICDFVTKKRDLIFEHFKKHPEHVSKCDETDYEINLLKLTPKIKKRYELTQKSEVKMDDQYLKYQCDKCTYKTFRSGHFNRHKLIHLKPEQIQWFYCSHCSYKAKQNRLLKVHILRHLN